MNITETRQAIASALNTIEDVKVRDRKAVKNPKTGDGWVTLGQIQPSSYSSSLITFVVVLILGSDVDAAEELFEEWAVDIIDSVTTAEDLNVANVVLEPISLVTEGGASLSALTLTLAAEVEA